MRIPLVAIFLLAGLTVMHGSTAFSQQPAAGDKFSLTAVEQRALAVVARRIDAYNAHDIETFLLAHAEDVQIIEYPDKRIGTGRSHLEWIFGPQFEQGLGSIEILYQTAIGNTIISHERISIGDDIETLVAIYTVENSVIVAVRLIEMED